MADHVPVAGVCQACSAPAEDCDLASAVLQGTAYGKCPLGCGAIGGDVEQAGDLAGFVRLWTHPYHAWQRLRHQGGDSRCNGSMTWVQPLPLAAPPDSERRRLRAAITWGDFLLDDDGYPLTLF